MSGPDISRGKYIGKRLGQPADEAEHFIKCPGCGGWIDCRDLACVFDHEEPLPHPAQDRPHPNATAEMIELLLADDRCWHKCELSARPKHFR
jgi:hypothetical protein